MAPTHFFSIAGTVGTHSRLQKLRSPDNLHGNLLLRGANIREDTRKWTYLRQPETQHQCCAHLTLAGLT